MTAGQWLYAIVLWRKWERGESFEIGGSMSKNNVMIFVFAAIAGFCGLHVATQIKAQIRSPGLPVPVVGKQYTVQQLLSLINRNNPAKTSNFIVPTSKGSVIQTSAGIDGSKSVDFAGLKGIIQGNLGTEVTLNDDPNLIQQLFNEGRLNNTTKPQYAKILLYFTLNGYRFYINDPYPAKIVVGRTNPAGQIINKWNLNTRF